MPLVMITRVIPHPLCLGYSYVNPQKIYFVRVRRQTTITKTIFYYLYTSSNCEVRHANTDLSSSSD